MPLFPWNRELWVSNVLASCLAAAIRFSAQLRRERWHLFARLFYCDREIGRKESPLVAPNGDFRFIVPANIRLGLSAVCQSVSSASRATANAVNFAIPRTFATKIFAKSHF